MKINDNEYNTIIGIVNQYGTLDTEFTEVQAQLELLDAKKNELLQRLEVIRKEELAFFDILKNNYGEGKLNLETLEYMTT